MSKTPQFDALLNTILDELVPHSRTCVDCENIFTIEKQDIELLKMLRAPTPTHCPECRQKRRLSFANYSNIYKRKCDVPGHTEIMISPVAPVMPWVTYDYETYYSDLWDPKSYGIPLEIEGDFFDQFLSLLKVIPQPGVRRGSDSPNSDFSFYGKFMKDCYYVFGGRRSEDIMYSSSVYFSKHVLDSYYIHTIDTGYNIVISNDCYKCTYTYFSSNCIECDFIFDCNNCSNCFGCVNLRNKSYCLFNEQLTKDEYKKQRAQIDLGSRAMTKESEALFWKLVKNNPIRATRNYHSQDVTGNEVRNSKNCHNVYQVSESENIRHASFAMANVHDSMDLSFGGRAELLYEDENVGSQSSNVKFSFAVKESTDCEYMMSSSNCSNCFGCIALTNASYMIFNTQYSEEEYFQAIDEIKTKMLQKGQYGEFFPMAFSPCAYNSSFAYLMYPMTEEEIAQRGLYFQADTETDLNNFDVITADDLPDNITDVSDEICNKVIIGKESGKPFKLTQREVTFYKQNNICLPDDTPNARMSNRFKLLNNFKVEQEQCFSCGKAIESSCRTSDGFKPYCEKCYLNEVI